MKVHPAVYILLKVFSRLFLVALFLGVPVALYIMRSEGIGFGAREALGKALSTPTLTVEVGKLAFDPFSGIVASGVVVTENINHGRLLARINRVSVSLKISELAQGRIVVDSLRLNGAEASIPAGPTIDAPRLAVTQISAEIQLQGDKLRLSRFECLGEGIRLNIYGEVLNPRQLIFPEPNEEEAGVDFSRVLDEVRTVMGKLTFPKGPPQVHVEFRVDATNPSAFKLPRVGIEISQFGYAEAGLADVRIEGAYINGVAQVSSWRMRDSGGEFQASGNWDVSSRRGEFSILSRLNPLQLLDGAGVFEVPEGVGLVGVPEIAAEVALEVVDGKMKPEVTGHFSVEGIDFTGVRFAKPHFVFAWKDGVFYSRDIGFSVGSGTFDGTLWVSPNDFRLKARTSIPPVEFLPVLKDPGARDFIGNMQFDALPEITCSLHATALDFATFSGNGTIKLGRTAVRGSWIDGGTAEFSIADRCIVYKNLEIKTGAGVGTGEFDYDIGLQEVRLRNVKSTLVPVDVMMWINPQIAKTIQPYRFRANPNVSVEGKVHMKVPTGNNLAIRVESPAGMEYDLLEKTLVFDSTSAEVQVIGSTVHVNVTNADLMGGQVSFLADVSIDPSDPTFKAELNLSRVNFSDLTKLYFDYDDSKGVVSGRYDFQMQMGQENLMAGKGSLRIEDGNVFAIPWLGPFSTILGGILPGVFYNNARLATADFTVGEERINTGNIEIAGTGFSMYGNGDIHFLTGGLNMNMRINVQGIPGLLFFPVSKILEYHSDGTIADPRWMPRLIPRLPIGIPGLQPKATTP